MLSGGFERIPGENLVERGGMAHAMMEKAMFT